MFVFACNNCVSWFVLINLNQTYQKRWWKIIMEIEQNNVSQSIEVQVCWWIENCNPTENVNEFELPEYP